MNILEKAKEIAVLVKKYNDQDLYERIVELREEILEIREENLELHEEVKRLKTSADISVRLRRSGNCYYLDDDETRLRPFCLTCWDADRKLVSLLHKPRNRIGCAICHARGKD